MRKIVQILPTEKVLSTIMQGYRTITGNPLVLNKEGTNLKVWITDYIRKPPLKEVEINLPVNEKWKFGMLSNKLFCIKNSSKHYLVEVK